MTSRYVQTRSPVRPQLLESLEPRLFLSASDPSAAEQYLLMLVNRMRQNPAGELPLLIHSSDPDVNNALTFFNVNQTVLAQQWATLTAAPPLAWNGNLETAATAHSSLMLADDTQSHQLPGEQDLGTRVTAAGYTWSNIGENVDAYATNPFDAHAGFAIDWGNTATGIQTPAGHRANIMSTAFSDIGLGIVTGTGTGTGNPHTGPMLVTEDFGAPLTAANPYILGAAFQDTNNDGYYSQGEGLAGINVHITGTGGTFNTTTLTAGGYQIRVPAGTYTVTFSGGSLPQNIAKVVTVGSSNAEVDAKSVVLGPAAKLVFGQQPAATTAKATLATTTVNVEDANGNLITTDNSSITLAIAVGPGTLGGTTTVAAVNGVATFTNLTLSAPGTITLKATDGSLTSATSSSFLISNAASNNPLLAPEYRLYLAQTAEHLYTTDFNEYTVLQTRGWSQEGIAYNIYNASATVGGVSDQAYYRLYNPGILQHLWTTDAHEYAVLGTQGWNQEGVIGYVFPSTITGGTTLYRLNINIPGNDLHLWTTDVNEYNTLASQYGWTKEGIIGYVLSQAG